jgi:hypothetical protein
VSVPGGDTNSSVGPRWVRTASKVTHKVVVLQIYSKMLGLKDGCLHPTSQKPYIKSLTGGTNNSPENMNVRD